MSPERVVHDRYHRQRLLSMVGNGGQDRLAGSHAVIVGCGALGCTTSDLLVRAGVGRVTIVDRDIVELTNLQRQMLFTEEDARECVPKAVAAKKRLTSINSDVNIVAHVADFNALSAERLVDFSDRSIVLLDGTDNFETRYLLNDLAVKHGVPYVYAGAVSTHAMSMTIVPGVSPCLRCVFPEAPSAGAAPTCDTAGVFGPVISIVGGYQASEAIKLMLGHGHEMNTALVQFDTYSNTGQRLELAALKNESCRCCSARDFDFLRGDHAPPVALCGRNAVQVTPRGASRIDLAALGERLSLVGTFRSTEFLLKGRIEASDTPFELTVFPDGRAIIGGTDEPDVARSLYARFVGS